MPVDAGARNRLLKADADILIHRYPGDDVAYVFHRASGETHLLNFLSLALYDFVAEGTNSSGGVSSSEVVTRLPQVLGLDAVTECTSDLILKTIENLIDVGLLQGYSV